MIGNCATLGSGGSGGVFAPSLYMGAMLGGAYGTAFNALFPSTTAGSGAYAMVGMAAFFAAAAKAPTTSILILFEMTNDYRIILPLMAATVASVTVSHRLLHHSIYTLKLHHRGIAFPDAAPPAASGHPAP
jgi:CIC family chloride channel protein